MRKVFATLRALIEVLEVLSRDADPNGVGRSIRDEVLFSLTCCVSKAI
jgi:callose synthase